MQYQTFKHNLIQHATEHHIPILGEFELTANCNFQCSFCYLNHKEKHPVLSTQQWKDIFMQAHQAGLMFANLTGGELFLRKDFIELYEFLYNMGIKITVFTNGSIIPDDVIELFKEKKTQFVAITIYGHDTDSYYEITRNKHAFKQVKQNILKLKKQGVPTILRTIPIQFIYERLDKVIDFVKSMDMKLYFFSYVTKTNCFEFQNQRLAPKDLIDFEDRIRTAFDYEIQPHTFEHDYKSCAALRSSYFINHLGEMMPCALAYTPKKSILNNDFLEVFGELRKEFMTLEQQNPCYSCHLLNKCNTCYARRLNEDGLSSCANYLKEVATLREDYYKIGDLDIGLKVTYRDFFTNNIEKYSAKEPGKNIYHISSKFVDKINLPDKLPDITYSKRLIYQDDDSETLYAMDDKSVIREKFKRSSGYETFEITLAGNDEEWLQEKEYIFTGIAFMNIASFNGYVPIHGSAIHQDNEVVIFSAPSQTGKSTLSNNWLNISQDSSILNDDKPLIYRKDNQLLVCGSPWSGKDIINQNLILPLKAIVFLKQGKSNKIEELDQKQKIYYLFRNINRPKDERSWNKMLETINEIVSNIPMYLAHITKDKAAAQMIYKTIYGGNQDED